MRLGTAALTLAFGLGVVGLASAQESGNWFTRMFSPGDKAAPAKKLDAKTDLSALPMPATNHRAIKAKADLDRRQEVCMKLIEIAIATGDADLHRKAELLDQRAYDLYVAAKNQSRALEVPAVPPDTKKGGR